MPDRGGSEVSVQVDGANMRVFVSLLLLCLSGLSWAKSIVGNRVLVVLEGASEKALFSQFWSDLESRDFLVSFETPKNDQLSLFKHGQLAFDHIILTPPKSKGYGPALTPKILLDYTNAGGNTLLCLSAESGTPTAIASLLLELDIQLSADRNSVVVDHFNFDQVSSPDLHDTLLLPRPAPLRPDVKNFFGGDGVLAVPKAVGQALGNNSPLLAPILAAPVTAYSYNPKEEGEAVEEPFASGSQLSIVSALQARNSARFTVLGSLEMLQDAWFTASVKGSDGKSVKTANRQFAQQLTEWTFKEVGVLKIGSITHYESDQKPAHNNSVLIAENNPSLYRIKNDVVSLVYQHSEDHHTNTSQTFTIEVSEYSHTHYIPFVVPPNDDLQLEFTMLSPFHRLSLQPATKSANSTFFTTSFKLPDQHGIFAFKVNYKRPFFNNVDERRQVTVRHMAHDEWPRSWVISGAWPWIGGLWSVIVGFLLFVAIWLYSEPSRDDRKTGNRSI